MSTSIPTRDVGDVQDVCCDSVGYVWQLEDGIKRKIKSEIGLG